MQILLEFGLIALITMVCIILIVIISLLKTRKNINITLLTTYLAFALLILHSIIDFDFSFFIVQMMMFVFLAVISREYCEINKNSQYINNTLIILLLMVNVCVCSANVNEKYLEANMFKTPNVDILMKATPYLKKAQLTYIDMITQKIILGKDVRQKEGDIYEGLVESVIKNERYHEVSIYIVSFVKWNYSTNNNEERNDSIKLVYEYIERYINDRSLNIVEVVYTYQEIRSIVEFLDENFENLTETEKHVLNKCVDLFYNTYIYYTDLIRDNENLRMGKETREQYIENILYICNIFNDINQKRNVSGK